MSEEQTIQAQDDLNGVNPASDALQNDDADGQENNDAESSETLAEKLASAQRAATENWDKLLRVQAEMDNLRRRTEKDLQNAHKYALEKFARDLLSVVDSLELGIQAATADVPEVTKLREGSELTLKQLLGTLERFGVVQIDPQGQKFSPDLHQAISVEPSAEVEPNTIVKVFQKGYQLNDRLLRPAMVVTAQQA
jgi:molecular chaperone GrpE